MHGEEYIQETPGDLSFELSDRTFSSSSTLSRLLSPITKSKKPPPSQPKKKVAGAYCCVGTIDLWLADQAVEVRGMDIIPKSIQDARKMQPATTSNTPNTRQAKLKSCFQSR
jgi:23S rRNA (uracil1939-C5)-methyltransferase